MYIECEHITDVWVNATLRSFSTSMLLKNCTIGQQISNRNIGNAQIKKETQTKFFSYDHKLSKMYSKLNVKINNIWYNTLIQIGRW